MCLYPANSIYNELKAVLFPVQHLKTDHLDLDCDFKTSGYFIHETKLPLQEYRRVFIFEIFVTSSTKYKSLNNSETNESLDKRIHQNR